jgi:tRNA modification GTPase
MIIGGLSVTVSDTAGLREAENPIEAEGVKRAKSRAKESEITIYVVRPSIEGIDSDILETLSENDIIYVNDFEDPKYEALSSGAHVKVADLIKGQGEQLVYDQLEDIIKRNFSIGHDVSLTRERHSDCVRRAEYAMVRARSQLSIASELAGDDLRSAMRAISELAGETDIEAVFDRIFSRFCVGK